MKTSFFLSMLLMGMPGLLLSQDAAKDTADKAADAVKIGTGIAVGEEVEMPKAIVRGRVYYEESGQPLRRSWVGFVKLRDILQIDPTKAVSPSPWDFVNAPSVLTNDFGEFVMRDVEPGVYQAVLKLPGILNPGFTDRENTIFQQFTFESGSESQIEVGVKKGGAVSGYVRYSDGAPLIGAEVSLLKIKPADSGEFETEELGSGLGSATTDDRGYYRFAGLPAGEYVVLTAEPSVFDGSDSKVSSYSVDRYFSTSELKTYFPNSKFVNEASRLQVYPGEELSDIDIMLAGRELFEVSGLVVGSKDNKLVDGIEIEFEKAEETGETDYQKKLIRTTTTDSEGRWRFKDLLPGKYVANISEPSYRRYREEEEEPLKRPNYASTQMPFEVLAGENRDVIFRISAEGTISGEVSVEGNRLLPDTVSVYADTRKERASSDSVDTTDYEADEARQKSRGDFKLDDLKSGEYFLTVSASEGYFAKSITYQGKDVSDSPIIIKESQQLRGVKVVLSSGAATVGGKVTDADPAGYFYVYMMPVKENVSLYRAYLQSENDYVGEDNSYEIQVRPGQYYLFVKDESIESPKKDSTLEEVDGWVRDLLKNAQRVTVSRGQKLSIDLEMPK